MDLSGERPLTDSTLSIERLSRAVSDGMLALDFDDARIVLSVYRLLARGEPVSPTAVAEATSLDQELVDKRLAEWPGVFIQDSAIVGFWGLALPQMSHRFEVEGKNLYTWCALDALFLPELIGKKATVRSNDPITGEEVVLTVHPERVEVLSPETIAISFLDPTTTSFDENVILNFCDYVHFFASQESAEKWTSENPGTFSLSIDEAFRLARLVNRAKFGEAFEETAPREVSHEVPHAS